MEKRQTGKRVAILALGILVLSALAMMVAGQPDRYEPPYRLSMKLERDPLRGPIQTPYRTLVTFRTQGNRDEVVRLVMEDLKKQGFHWRLKKPSGQDVSYHIDNPVEPDRSRAEGLNIYADPSDPRTTIVSVVSPWRQPSKFQIWWYETSKWIRRDNSLL